MKCFKYKISVIVNLFCAEHKKAIKFEKIPLKTGMLERKIIIKFNNSGVRPLLCIYVAKKHLNLKTEQFFDAPWP